MSGESLAGSRVLVTGASGFLGSYIMERLAGTGAEVIAVSRTIAETRRPGFVAVRCDLQDHACITNLVTKMRPDFAFHLAGLVTTAPETRLILPMLHANVVATVNLLSALSESGCRRVVQAGSTGEGMSSPYGVSKIAAGLYGTYFYQQTGLPIVQARLHFCYGPRQCTNKLIPSVILSSLAGIPQPLKAPGRVCDFIYAGDAADGLVAALTTEDISGRTVDICTGQSIAIQHAVTAIQKMVDGGPAEFHFQPTAMEETVTAWAWTAGTRLPVGLAETISWYRENRQQ